MDTCDRINFGDILRAIREHLFLTMEDVTSRGGPHRHSVRAAEQAERRVEIQPATFKKLAAAYDLTPGDLQRLVDRVDLSIARRGSSSVEDAVAKFYESRTQMAEMAADYFNSQNGAKAASRVKGDASARIPIINRVPAGKTSDFTNMDYPAGVADDYIDRGDINDDLAFAFHVFGDSMEPDYRMGDVAIVGGRTQPQSGDDCYLRFAADAGRHAGNCTLKRVEFSEPNLILRPLNPAFQVEVVPREWVEQCYPVVEVRRKMLRR